MKLLPVFPAYYNLLDKLGWFALRGAGIGVIVYLLLPVVVIIPLSFSDSSFLAYPIEGWSLQWYREMFASDDWSRAAKNSFIVAPLATLLATATLAAAGAFSGLSPAIAASTPATAGTSAAASAATWKPWAPPT